MRQKTDAEFVDGVKTPASLHEAKDVPLIGDCVRSGAALTKRRHASTAQSAQTETKAPRAPIVLLIHMFQKESLFDIPGIGSRTDKHLTLPVRLDRHIELRISN